MGPSNSVPPNRLHHPHHMCLWNVRGPTSSHCQRWETAWALLSATPTPANQVAKPNHGICTPVHLPSTSQTRTLGVTPMKEFGSLLTVLPACQSCPGNGSENPNLTVGKFCALSLRFFTLRMEVVMIIIATAPSDGCCPKKVLPRKPLAPWLAHGCLVDASFYYECIEDEHKSLDLTLGSFVISGPCSSSPFMTPARSILSKVTVRPVPQSCRALSHPSSSPCPHSARQTLSEPVLNLTSSASSFLPQLSVSPLHLVHDTLNIGYKYICHVCIR